MRYPTSIAALLGILALASPPAFAANVAHGEQLYQSFCVSCHGFPPIGGPERAANDPARIRTALNTVFAMRSAFQSITFSNSDLEDIAAFIASLSAPPPVVPAFDLTDLWWNPLENGWGFNVIQHASNNIFGVMYTYDAAGKATWFILPGGTWTTPMQFTGPGGRSSGSPANGVYQFSPASQVGTATINFIDRDNASLTFTVDGVPTTKTMSRLPF